VIGCQQRCVTLPDRQVLYANDNSFRVRVVAGPGFSAPEEAALVKPFLLRVAGVAVAVERMPAIAWGPHGKFAFVALGG
jgi:hypothetical protein